MSRQIEMSENDGVFAIVTIGTSGFGQIHVSLLKEILERAHIDFEETVV